MNITLGRNEILTLVGAMMVAVGAFMPMINIGGFGTMSYADAADPEVYLLVLFALGAAVMLHIEKLRIFSLVDAIGAWIVLLWPVISNMGGGSSDRGGLLDQLFKVTDPIQKAATEVTGKIFSNIFDMEPGGYVFLIGMILMTVGAVMAFLAARKS